MTLRIENLCIGYGRSDVLAAANAAAEHHHITVVIGPNAAGKTTLLRCVAGLLRPRSGHALLDGADIHAQSPALLAKRLAYMPQRPQVSGGLSVRAVVELGRYTLPPDDEAVSRAMNRMELIETASQRFDALSVGQQQRVSLARAIAQVAADGLLVLDEPMAAVDLSHTREFVQIMRELAAGGAMILCAMHDLSLAAAIADHVWLLDGGTVECGRAEDVLRPGRLEEAFGVPFRWVTLPGEPQQVLLPELHVERYTQEP